MCTLNALSAASGCGLLAGDFERDFTPVGRATLLLLGLSGAAGFLFVSTQLWRTLFDTLDVHRSADILSARERRAGIGQGENPLAGQHLAPRAVQLASLLGTAFVGGGSAGMEIPDTNQVVFPVDPELVALG